MLEDVIGVRVLLVEKMVGVRVLLVKNVVGVRVLLVKNVVGVRGKYCNPSEQGGAADHQPAE
jgi:hypothetical protein